MSKTSDWLLDPEREHDESICYDDDLPIYEAAMAAALEARGLEVENAALRLENETLKMMLPPIGSLTFPPGCQQYEEAKALVERRILEGC